ncbi:carbohydrate porin [Trinickia sp.]|uniref:carbohydrate porin n=1 Tax=Trinickia sp. TaxID=2571163 RepID=UPI003F7DB363
MNMIRASIFDIRSVPAACAARRTPARLAPVAAATLVLLATVSGVSTSARAQTAPAATAAAPSPAAPEGSTPNAASPDAAKGTQADAAPTGLWDRATLFGDMGGVRTLLGNRGVTLSLQETSELFGNFSGGTRRGLAYDGATQFGLSVDTDKAIGLKGGQFFVDALQIHGHGITASHLSTLQSVSGVEAEPTTRLWELWYQQSFGDAFDVKIGQQSLDQEFIVSQYGSAFLNATFGWPVLAAADMPAGGPAYPLSSLGVRARYKVSDAVTVLGGVFDGNPAPGIGDAQKLNGSGTRFNLHDGALFIGELQYAIGQAPAPGAAPSSNALPGTYKLGFWYDNARFADPREGTDGLSLANPASNGQPRMRHGNFSVYAVADQMVWRPSPDAARSIGVFARVMGAPGDRNAVDFSANAGVVMKAPFAGRDNDSVGLALGYADTGSHASAFDRDTGAATTPGYPVRTAETVVEATYQYQVAPWWLVQADFQYFFRPGGGVPNPSAGGARIGNEAVAGVRTVLTF